MSDELLPPPPSSDDPKPADSPVKTPPADAARLEHVIDDEEPRQVWGRWAVDEMTRNRQAEEVAADLVANGWDADAAEEMAEEARRQTRHLRGVVTREDVAYENEAKYRRAMGRMGLRWSIAFLNPLTAWKLLRSLADLFSSRRRLLRAQHGFDVLPGSEAAPPPEHPAAASEEPPGTESSE